MKINQILAPFKTMGLFWQHVFLRFLHDGCFYRASALTFTTLLALVPLIFVALSVLSAFPIFADLTQDIQDFVFANFVPSTGTVVKSYILDFVSQAGKLSMIGICFLVVTAIMMLFTIEQAFNNIWRVKRRRQGVATFMLYWAILTLSPILLGASFALSMYLIALPEVTSTAAYFGLTELLLSSVVFVLVWLVFSILFITIPNCRVPLRFGFLGGLLCTILYEFAHTGFTFYITNFPTYRLIYGALATIPIFLLWVYLLWLIVLFSGEFTQSLTYRHTITGKQKLQPFIHAMQWLACLWQAQHEGRSMTLLALVQEDKCRYEIAPEAQIEALEQAGLVVRLKNGRYMLAVDLSTLTIADLYHKLPWKLPLKPVDLNSILWKADFNQHLQNIDKNITDLLKHSLTKFVKLSD